MQFIDEIKVLLSFQTLGGEFIRVGAVNHCYKLMESWKMIKLYRHWDDWAIYYQSLNFRLTVQGTDTFFNSIFNFSNTKLNVRRAFAGRKFNWFIHRQMNCSFSCMCDYGYVSEDFFISRESTFKSSII
jgi:hypothetical protein